MCYSNILYTGRYDIDGAMLIASDGGGEVGICKVDLDIDSDNNNGLDLPDRNKAEDDIEDAPGDDKKPQQGKWIYLNDDDNDGDDVKDWVDGFGPQRRDDPPDVKKFATGNLKRTICANCARASAETD